MKTSIYKPSSSLNKLYVIASPIGNLKEISQRAIDVFNSCNIWYCEDTRVSIKIVNHLNLKNIKLFSYREHNEESMLLKIKEQLETSSAILISDAGYPCISDPGYRLVNYLIENKIAIEVINGPSSIMHSIVASGINCERFYFHGFLSSKSNQRDDDIKNFKNYSVPIIFFESPNRIKDTLLSIHKILNKYEVSICKELTKINETIYRTSNIEEIIDLINDKGEYVVILRFLQEENQILSKEQIIDKVNFLVKNKGYKTKEACKIVADKNNMSSSEVYKMIVDQ